MRLRISSGQMARIMNRKAGEHSNKYTAKLSNYSGTNPSEKARHDTKTNPTRKDQG